MDTNNNLSLNAFLTHLESDLRGQTYPFSVLTVRQTATMKQGRCHDEPLDSLDWYGPVKSAIHAAELTNVVLAVDHPETLFMHIEDCDLKSVDRLCRLVRRYFFHHLSYLKIAIAAVTIENDGLSAKEIIQKLNRLADQSLETGSSRIVTFRISVDDLAQV